jgi:predicted transcriptional regulator
LPFLAILEIFNELNFPGKSEKDDINKNVHLHKAENAWQPSHMKSADLAELLKNFQRLLYKITEENFEKLVKNIHERRNYVINSPKKISAVSLKTLIPFLSIGMLMP